MTDKKNVPEIRFMGFEGKWSKKEINSVADRYDNLRVPIAASKRISGNTPYYGANGIQDYVEGYTHDGEFILIAEDGANDLKNYPVQYANGKIWVNNHAHVLQAKKQIADNQFLRYSFSQTNIEPLLVGGGRAKLNSEIMMKIEMDIPFDLNEQSRIGTYFQNIDKLITLHQAKYNKLVNIKKAMLEKMFPKNGADVPEIRFKGFVGKWEEKKLGGTISFIVDNRGKNPKYYCSDGIPIIDNFMIKNNCYPNLNEALRFIDDSLFSDFIRKYNEVDDVLITLVGNGIGNVTLFPKQKSVIIQNTLGLRFFNNQKFMFYSLLSKNKQIKSLNRGMAQPSIRQDELLDIDLKLPGDIEQTKISEFLYKLDKLITLHKKELEKLKNIKKACLEKMFV